MDFELYSVIQDSIPFASSYLPIFDALVEHYFKFAGLLKWHEGARSESSGRMKYSGRAYIVAVC